MSKQDVRLENTVTVIADLVSHLISPFVKIDRDTLQLIVKKSTLGLLSELGVDTAGIKTESNSITINIED